jgi:hypothetical protein
MEECPPLEVLVRQDETSAVAASDSNVRTASAPEDRLEWSIWWDENWYGKREGPWKTSPLPQMLPYLTWDRIQIAASESRLLNTSVMTPPKIG